MCGFAGACWTQNAQPITIEELRNMTAVLSHRGPDEAGFYHSHHGGLFSESTGLPSSPAGDQNGPAAALGHRRLSIIDLESGHQPLSNEEGSVWIVFNGEIYNYRELRSKLEGQGHQFRTSSDTETIVHLYEEYGVDCVTHLRGMFSFAIWDQRKRTLLLARDRLGQKPLFYRLHHGRLVFASELKALLQLSDANRELNPQAVDGYLTYQYVPHPDCILKGYQKLPPAHRAVFTDGRLEIESYWSPPYSDPNSTNPQYADCDRWSSTKWREMLRETMTESVRLRMRSDVPLGAFLSGGIDSTIIVGLMQQLSQRPVHTFSIGFPVKKFDETSYAREAAKFLGTEHHEAVVTPNAIEILPKLIWHYDEPFADSSAIPTMYLSDMTRQTVTVALSGDGGDELFAGYDRYQAVRLAQRFDQLPRVVKRLLTARLWQKIPASVDQKSFRRRGKRFLAELARSPEERYLRWINIFDADRRNSLYTNDFAGQFNANASFEFLHAAYEACPSRDFVTRTTCADVLTYLPCDILTKVDIASMAYGLECRSPFLDHHVAELAARMPISLKQHGRIGKRILIDTFSDLLPASIQHRSKMGFGVPLDHWFREELKPLLHDTLLDSVSLDRGYFRPEVVRRLIDEHTEGGWDHSYRLWSLLCFEMWHRMYLDADSLPTTCPSIL